MKRSDSLFNNLLHSADMDCAEMQADAMETVPEMLITNMFYAVQFLSGFSGQIISLVSLDMIGNQGKT